MELEEAKILGARGNDVLVEGPIGTVDGAFSKCALRVRWESEVMSSEVGRYLIIDSEPELLAIEGGSNRDVKVKTILSEDGWIFCKLCRLREAHIERPITGDCISFRLVNLGRRVRMRRCDGNGQTDKERPEEDRKCTCLATASSSLLVGA